MLWVLCHEAIGSLSDRHFNVEGYDPPAMIHTQVGLQARACRVGVEVLALLRAGLGALGRARALPEIATISTILAKHGALDGAHPDLADRYLLHAHVVSWLDAVEYQIVAPKLGYEQLTDDEMATLQQPRDESVGEYGEAFGKANGWVACLPNRQPEGTPSQ